MDKKEQFICPFCGALVPVGALSCPKCGSDETTGWSDDLMGIRSENHVEESRNKNNPWSKYLYIFIVVLIILGLMQFSIRGYILLGLIIGILFLTISITAINKKMGRSGHSGESEYSILLFKDRGDKELVKRLIDYEKQKNPFRTQKELIRDVLDRWAKDAR